MVTITKVVSVNLILRYSLLNDPKDKKKEEIVNTKDFNNSTSAAINFGFFINQPIDPFEPNIIAEGERYFKFNEMNSLDNSNFQNPEDQLVEYRTRVQSYFEHQIDIKKYSYEIGIFDVREVVLPPPKPPKPVPGLSITLGWITKDNKEEFEETFFVKDLTDLYFINEMSLTNENITTVFTIYELSGFLGRPQEYYLENLYRHWGGYITHQYDTTKYNYTLSCEQIG